MSEIINRKTQQELVTRVKAFVINSSDEVLIVSSFGGCQLVGGHVDEGEDLDTAMIREVSEEAGIELDKNDEIKPFYEIKHNGGKYQKSGRRRASRIVYYLIVTDKKPNINNIHLTDREIEYGLSVGYIKLSDFEQYVKNVIITTDKEVNKIIAREMLEAYAELKKIL